MSIEVILLTSGMSAVESGVWGLSTPWKVKEFQNRKSYFKCTHLEMEWPRYGEAKSH